MAAKVKYLGIVLGSLVSATGLCLCFLVHLLSLAGRDTSAAERYWCLFFTPLFVLFSASIHLASQRAPCIGFSRAWPISFFC